MIFTPRKSQPTSVFRLMKGIVCSCTRNFRCSVCFIGLVGLATTVMPAEAAEGGSFFLGGGPAYANFDASTRVKVAGVEVPGADATVSTNTGAEFEAGNFIDSQWSVTLTIGVPPKDKFFGGGTLASAGKLAPVSALVDGLNACFNSIYTPLEPSH